MNSMMVPSMLASRFFVLATAAFALAAPALACNLHPPGQIGGFHRYNPFASALQQMPPAPRTSLAKIDSETDKAEQGVKKEQEDKRRQKVQEESAVAKADAVVDLRSGAQGRGVP